MRAPKLNQGSRRNAHSSYSEDPTDHLEEGARHARQPLGLNPPNRIHPPHGKGARHARQPLGLTSNSQSARSASARSRAQLAAIANATMAPTVPATAMTHAGE